MPKKYIEKYGIENEKEFIDGTIYPDLVSDKSVSHYGIDARRTNLHEFLLKNDIRSDFNKGYFLHLVVDDYFYKHLLKDVDWEHIGRKLYEDYDALNRTLMERYSIELPDEVKKFVYFNEAEKLNLLNQKMIEQMITKLVSTDLSAVVAHLLSCNGELEERM